MPKDNLLHGVKQTTNWPRRRKARLCADHASRSGFGSNTIRTEFLSYRLCKTAHAELRRRIGCLPAPTSMGTD